MRSQTEEILTLLRSAVEAKDGCAEALEALGIMTVNYKLTPQACGQEAYSHFMFAQALLSEALTIHQEGQEWHDDEWDNFDGIPDDPCSIVATAWGHMELYYRSTLEHNNLN